MGVARRLLDRVPDEQHAWKPHAKSMTLGRLAEHVAELPIWITRIVTRDGFDLATPRPEGYRTPATRAELLAFFDRNVADARAALAGRKDPELLAPWTLERGGAAMFTLPRAGALRSIALNHLVHHRGQLSVYLRLQDVPVPSMYGPSADEGV